MIVVQPKLLQQTLHDYHTKLYPNKESLIRYAFKFKSQLKNELKEKFGVSQLRWSRVMKEFSVDDFEVTISGGDISVYRYLVSQILRQLTLSTRSRPSWDKPTDSAPKVYVENVARRFSAGDTSPILESSNFFQIARTAQTPKEFWYFYPPVQSMQVYDTYHSWESKYGPELRYKVKLKGSSSPPAGVWEMRPSNQLYFKLFDIRPSTVMEAWFQCMPPEWTWDQPERFKVMEEVFDKEFANK